MRLTQHTSSSSPALEYAWECSLFVANIVVSAWMLHNAFSLKSVSFIPLEMLITTSLSAVLALVLWWNVLCILALRICTVGLLPARGAHSVLRMLQRWGSSHTRRIAARHLLRSTALATLASSCAIAGAHAAPETSPSTVQSEATVSAQVLSPSSLPVPLSAPPSVHEVFQAPADSNGVTTGAHISLPPPTTVAPDLLPRPHIDAIDTFATQAASSSQREHDVIVESGESLWSIAAEQLPEGDDSALAALVDRIYDINHDVIGPNPDIIHPGMTIRIPSFVQEPS